MTDKTTLLIARLAATRLDATVSAESFTTLLLKLVDAAYDAGVADEKCSPYPPPPSPSPDPSPEPPPAPATPAPAKPNGHAPANTTRGYSTPPGGYKLSYDDKARIRSRHAEATADNAQLPPGFVRGLAAEFEVSDQTIYNVLRGADGT